MTPVEELNVWNDLVDLIRENPEEFAVIRETVLKDMEIPDSLKDKLSLFNTSLLLGDGFGYIVSDDKVAISHKNSLVKRLGEDNFSQLEPLLSDARVAYQRIPVFQKRMEHFRESASESAFRVLRAEKKARSLTDKVKITDGYVTHLEEGNAELLYFVEQLQQSHADDLVMLKHEKDEEFDLRLEALVNTLVPVIEKERANWSEEYARLQRIHEVELSEASVYVSMQDQEIAELADSLLVAQKRVSGLKNDLSDKQKELVEKIRYIKETHAVELERFRVTYEHERLVIETERDSLQGSNNSLNSQNHSLEYKLDIATDVITNLQDKYSDVELGLLQAKAKALNWQRKYAGSRGANASLSKRYHSLKADYEKALVEKSESEVVYQEALVEKVAAEKDLKQAKSDSKKAQEASERAVIASKKALDAKKNADDAREKVESEKQVLISEIEKVKTEYVTMVQHYGSLEKDRNSLDRQVDSLQSDLDSLAEKYFSLEKQFKDSSEKDSWKIDDLEVMFSDVVNKHNLLLEKAKVLEDNNHELLMGSIDYASENLGLKKELDSYDKKISDLEKDFFDTVKIIKDLEDKVITAQNKVASAEQRADDAESKLYDINLRPGLSKEDLEKILVNGNIDYDKLREALNGAVQITLKDIGNNNGNNNGNGAGYGPGNGSNNGSDDDSRYNNLRNQFNDLVNRFNDYINNSDQRENDLVNRVLNGLNGRNGNNGNGQNGSNGADAPNNNVVDINTGRPVAEQAEQEPDVINNPAGYQFRPVNGEWGQGIAGYRAAREDTRTLVDTLEADLTGAYLNSLDAIRDEHGRVDYRKLTEGTDGQANAAFEQFARLLSAYGSNASNPAVINRFLKGLAGFDTHDFRFKFLHGENPTLKGYEKFRGKSLEPVVKDMNQYPVLCLRQSDAGPVVEATETQGRVDPSLLSVIDMANLISIYDGNGSVPDEFLINKPFVAADAHLRAAA